jgi:hypothetical protein
MWFMSQHCPERRLEVLRKIRKKIPSEQSASRQRLKMRQSKGRNFRLLEDDAEHIGIPSCMASRPKRQKSSSALP